MISNDSIYGGAGGIPAITSLDPSASDIIAHELFGHSFAHLGDEYTSAYPGYPDIEEPNTIKSPNGPPASPKWAQWIGNNPAEFDKTPNLQVQAPIQGAHYHDTGWYRPATNCKMSTYGVPFCPVCSEAVIRSIYSKIKPIDSVTPAAGVVDTSQAGWSLSVLTSPANETLKIEWSVNGKTIDLAAPTFNQDSLSAAISQDSTIVAPYQVQVKVSDTTDLVTDKGRADGLLQDTVTWNLK
jgi:hypothetical protein